MSLRKVRAWKGKAKGGKGKVTEGRENGRKVGAWKRKVRRQMKFKEGPDKGKMKGMGRAR